MACHKHLLLLIISLHAVACSKFWDFQTFEDRIEHIIKFVEIYGDFQRLIARQIRVNNNSLTKSDLKEDLILDSDNHLKMNCWNLTTFLLENPHIIKIQEPNNVCETGKSQLQSIQRSFDLYMIAVSRCIYSQHIIYNTREYFDNDDTKVDRKIFNNKLREDVQKDLKRFEYEIKDISTEYWLCDPPKPVDPSNFIPEMRQTKLEGISIRSNPEKRPDPFDQCKGLQRVGYQCICSVVTKHFGKRNCIMSTMVINLAMIKADPGYVLTGVQLTIDGKILGIAAKQGKLLSNGKIDENTVKPVIQENDEATYADFVLTKDTLLLGETKVPQGRFLTGIGFQNSDEGFYIASESSKFDFRREEFITNETRVEQYVTNSFINGTKFARTVYMKKDSNGKLTVQWSNRTNLLIDNRMIEQSPTTPLSGITLFIRRKDSEKKSEDQGFLTIKINSRVLVPVFLELPSFSDFPIREILNNVSNKTSYGELEKKFIDFIL